MRSVVVTKHLYAGQTCILDIFYRYKIENKEG